MAKREMDSQVFWHQISEDQRFAIQLVVKDALITLIERPERWLPASIDPTKGDRLDITISVQLPAIEAEALAQRVDTARLKEQTAAELRRLERALRPGGSDGT